MDNLLEDLSHMNRAILNAEPIPAGSDKLKDELEDNKVGGAHIQLRNGTIWNVPFEVMLRMSIVSEIITKTMSLTITSPDLFRIQIFFIFATDR